MNTGRVTPVVVEMLLIILAYVVVSFSQPPTVTRVDVRGGATVIQRPDTVVVWINE